MQLNIPLAALAITAASYGVTAAAIQCLGTRPHLIRPSLTIVF